MRKASSPILFLCGFASATGAWGQMAGTCLDVVELGPWVPIEETAASPDARVPPPADDDVRNAFPVRIRLLETPLSDGRGFEVEIPEGSQQTPHSRRAWSLSSETLHVSLHGGVGSGVDAKLRAEGGMWRGTLRTFTDNVGTLLYERTLGLAPVDCATPPPVAASEDMRLPRIVELASGQRLELGLELPPDVATEPRDSHYLTIADEPAGRFAAADTVIVELGRRSGRIANIELRFPSDFDLRQLVGSLEAELGPGRDIIGKAWENRTTRLWVASEASAHRRVRLTDPRFTWEF